MIRIIYCIYYLILGFMKFFKLNTLTLLFIFCFAVNGFTLSFAEDNQLGCHYLAATQPAVDGFFFHELIVRGHHAKETFHSIIFHLEQHAATCHRFEFKYPLKDQDHARIFAKVLQIKAQEAHRFVPSVALSQFISPSHLGFIREIIIKDNGPVIQEHVLVDQDSDRVIFIEESVDLDGTVQLGNFAALNGVREEEGIWYFVGVYLYDWQPDSSDQIDEVVQGFQATYENMLSFIENEDVDAVYNQLQQYSNEDNMND